MQIHEMRSALAADFESKNPRNGGFPNAPDWAVKRMWEHRSGLPFSPLPATALRNLDGYLARRIKRAVTPAPVAKDEVPQEDFDARKRRLAFLKAI